jgi:hypothetical protein
MIFLGVRNQSEFFYVEFNGNFIIELRIFTLRTVFGEGIMFGYPALVVYLNLLTHADRNAV